MLKLMADISSKSCLWSPYNVFLGAESLPRLTNPLASANISRHWERMMFVLIAKLYLPHYSKHELTCFCVIIILSLFELPINRYLRSVICFLVAEMNLYYFNFIPNMSMNKYFAKLLINSFFVKYYVIIFYKLMKTLNYPTKVARIFLLSKFISIQY